jgi:hypothetical protein
MSLIMTNSRVSKQILRNITMLIAICMTLILLQVGALPE